MLLGLFACTPMVFAQDDAEPATTEETAAEDDTQLIAVITAAIAAYNAQSGNSLPFRVVSFKRANGANGWNSK